MADEATVAALEASVEAAREVVTTQGDVVRQLKAEVKDGTAERVRRCRSRSPRACRCRRARSPTHPPPRSQSAVDAAIEKLKQLRMELDQKVKVGTPTPIVRRREPPPPPPPPPPPLTDTAPPLITNPQELGDASGATTSSSREAFRAAVVNVLERRLFFIPSFKIYGAVAGLYDYGPPGCAVKQNVTQAWRQHFVLEEAMLEVECPAVTPEPVLRASGHVERFTDLMVTDVGTGDCHRADHLLEAALEALLEAGGKEAPTREEAAAARDLLARVGELKAPELGAALTQYGVKAPGTGADISAPFPFNLMFKTSIGPRGDMVRGCLSVAFARFVCLNLI
jgi:glycyl-tRNA synthetase